MNITALLAAVGVCLAMAEAKKTTLYAEEIEPFKQPEIEGDGVLSTAIEYKPQLNTFGKLYSYAYVDHDGFTSKGLSNPYACSHDPHQSQVYSRAMWYEKHWAQMYAWYVPCNKKSIWLNVVLWLNNPDVNKQEIFAASFSESFEEDDDDDLDVKYVSYSRKHLTIEGSTVMVKISKGGLFPHNKPGGEFQALISWNKLPKQARDALNVKNVNAPFSNEEFEDNLKKAWESTKNVL